MTGIEGREQGSRLVNLQRAELQSADGFREASDELCFTTGELAYPVGLV